MRRSNRAFVLPYYSQPPINRLVYRTTNDRIETPFHHSVNFLGLWHHFLASAKRFVAPSNSQTRFRNPAFAADQHRFNCAHLWPPIQRLL